MMQHAKGKASSGAAWLWYLEGSEIKRAPAAAEESQGVFNLSSRLPAERGRGDQNEYVMSLCVLVAQAQHCQDSQNRLKRCQLY